MNSESTPRHHAMVHVIRAENGKSWSDVLLSPEAERQLREIHDWLVKKRVSTARVATPHIATPHIATPHIASATVASGETANRTAIHPHAADESAPDGYPVLFAGAAGTGKTLTATLLGKELKMRVLRVDLSQVVSRYIGETEKNLERIFEQAAADDAILFFDEADALFGKRSEVADAHDKYANEDVGYLLQKIEAYPGLVILATRRRASIDDAFIKRLRAIVHFTAPR